MNINLTIGEKIQIARQRRGIKIDEFNTMVYRICKRGKGKPPIGRIRKIERGLLQNEISDEEFKAIAEVLNFPVEFFKTGETTMRRKDDHAKEYLLSPDIVNQYPEFEKYLNLFHSSFNLDRNLCPAILHRMAEHMENVNHLTEEKIRFEKAEINRWLQLNVCFKLFFKMF